MEAENRAVGSFAMISDCRKELVKVVDASCRRTHLTFISPSVTVEIRIRRIHHTMEGHIVTFRVLQLIATDMKSREADAFS